MKTGKAGTELPERAGITVRQFPIEAFAGDSSGVHDLGEILPPAQRAAKVPAWFSSPQALENNARNGLAALIGRGPEQAVPHSATAAVLADGLARLRDFALAGDLDAMRALGFVLSQAVADLAELARRKAETVREWSRTQNVVPVLTGKNVGHRKLLAADLDAFAVGEASPYRVNPPPGRKGPDSSTPANALAAELCKHLDLHRALFAVVKKPAPKWARFAAHLPPLSNAEGVRELWVKAAWECLLDATDKHPEKRPHLAALGVKAKGRDGLQSPRTLAANVRSEIRQTLREAILAIASVPPAVYSE